MGAAAAVLPALGVEELVFAPKLNPELGAAAADPKLKAGLVSGAEEEVAGAASAPAKLGSLVSDACDAGCEAVAGVVLLAPKEKDGAELAAGGFCAVDGIDAELTGAVFSPPKEILLGVVDEVLDKDAPKENVGLAAPPSDDVATLDVKLPNATVEVDLLGSSPLEDKLLRGLSKTAPKLNVGLTSAKLVAVC